MQPSILRAFGWRFAMVLTKDWYHNPDDVLARLEKLLKGEETAEPGPEDDEPSVEPDPAPVAKSVEPIPPPAPSTISTPSDPAAKSTSSVRYFEFESNSSKKFWEISLSSNTFTVRFGRIGAAGQSQTKTFADEAKARRETENLITEKLKKGYVERAA